MSIVFGIPPGFLSTLQCDKLFMVGVLLELVVEDILSAEDDLNCTLSSIIPLAFVTIALFGRHFCDSKSGPIENPSLH